MARPPAKELTERELEVMHVLWNRGELTVAEVARCARGRRAGPGVHDDRDAGPDPHGQTIPDPDE